MDYPKYYKKAIKGSVGGRFLNKKGDEEEFLLRGDPASPETDTVEIFNADAEKFFKKSNKAAIKNGYLLEISEDTIVLDESNAVSDGFLRDLLKQPFTKMKVRVNEFTSPVPVARLLEIALADNKPVKTVDYLKSVLAKLDAARAMPNRISGDNIKVVTI